MRNLRESTCKGLRRVKIRRLHMRRGAADNKDACGERNRTSRRVIDLRNRSSLIIVSTVEMPAAEEIVLSRTRTILLALSIGGGTDILNLPIKRH